MYNLGVEDYAYVPNGDYNNPTLHMHALVYHEGVARKGANYVCSLITKTMKMKKMIQGGECAAEFNIVFDNRSGHNKTIMSSSWYPILLRWVISSK